MGKDVHSNTGMCPWPVGSHLFNDGQNPGEIWGGTTWEQIKEKFPLGCGDTHAAGTSGGEFEHKLITDEMPKHSHNTAKGRMAEGSNIQMDRYQTYQGEDSITPGKYWYASTLYTGGDKPHNITPLFGDLLVAQNRLSA